MTDPVTNPFQQALNTTPSGTPDQGANAGIESYLNQIVNDKGEPKYKTVPDAIVALKNSQEHISNLERENQDLRARTQQATTIDQILAQLDSTKNSNDDNQTGFRMEDVKKIVLDTFHETETQRKATQNLATVHETLKSAFGEKFSAEYANKATELGLSTQVLDQLATVSPQAVLEYFGKDKVKNTIKSIQGSVNTESFLQNNQQRQPPKSIMYGASTSDMIAAWKAVSDNFNN